MTGPYDGRRGHLNEKELKERADRACQKARASQKSLGNELDTLKRIAQRAPVTEEESHERET